VLRCWEVARREERGRRGRVEKEGGERVWRRSDLLVERNVERKPM